MFKALRWVSFGDELLFEITFPNSRGGILFKMNAANTEIDNYKTIKQ